MKKTETTLEIKEILKNVIDPEIGINIVDLGFIYEIKGGPGETIEIDMTLTTPGCPMSEIIPASVEEVLAEAFPGSQILVKLVWEPAWNPELISSEGKRQMAMND